MVYASLLEDLLEQVWEACGDKTGILVVGDTAKEKHEVVNSARTRGMKVAWWEEIWEVAEKGTAEKMVSPGSV